MYRNIRCLSSWRAAIGLEFHVQLTAATSKLFSSASSDSSLFVNSSVHPLDMGLPGTLPVLNRQCAEMAVNTALSLNMELNMVSYFDRKHYIYADMPLNYQITQYHVPLARNGCFSVPFEDSLFDCYVDRLQLEIDSGKSLYEDNRCLLDLNRSGIALMEIVLKPNIENGNQAVSVLKELITILRLLKVSNCRMAEGALRVDANVSVNRADSEALGVRTELKNLGSARALRSAVDLEIARQIDVLQHGGVLFQETRAFDDVNKCTVSLRVKDSHQDYRYIRDMNLLPLRLANNLSCSSEDLVNVNDVRVRRRVEIPDETRARLFKSYELSLKNATILMSNDGMLDYFERVMNLSENKSGVKSNTCVWMLYNFLMSSLNKRKLKFTKCLVSHAACLAVLDRVSLREIAMHRLNELFESMWTEGVKCDYARAARIITKGPFLAIKDEITLTEVCNQVLRDNALLISKYRSSSNEKRRERSMKSIVRVVEKKLENRAEVTQIKRILHNILLVSKSNTQL